MNVSAKWILTQLPWLAESNAQEVEAKMDALGHKLAIGRDIWKFSPRQNRSDLSCAIGMMREVSAVFGRTTEVPSINVLEENIGSIYDSIDADLWSDSLCNRLTVKLCTAVTKGKTPDWMKERIRAGGLSWEDTVNDIASYVMLELGQPILMLDADKVGSGTLTLREAMGFEQIENVPLSYGLPVLENDGEVLAVPHFAVSANATVTANTQNLILIAVNYPSDIIDQCQEAFGIDSTQFSTDPMQTITAVQRACQLMQQLDYGKVLDGTIDLLNFVPEPRFIEIEALVANTDSISQHELAAILSLIGISTDGVIPSWRPDLDSSEAVYAEVLALSRANALSAK